MIDPRMLRPDAIAPTTDIVTPSPQYFGQGQVVGGQVQLGDVFGQLPSQSQEEYLYGSLASMAQSAMGMFKFPAQMKEAEMQRNTQQDNDKFFQYSTAQNELQQAQLNQEGVFRWNDEEYDISNPELFNSLELKMQEHYLNGMKTKRGIAEASEIKTRSLAQRNQNVDGRVRELMVEWEEAYKQFSTDNLLLGPNEFYNALQSNPRLTTIRNQLQSYRDTDSTTLETALLTIFNTDNEAFKALKEFNLQAGTELLINTTGEMVAALPSIIPLLQEPSGPAAVVNWLGPIENPEPLFDQIGLTKNAADQWEIQSGSLLDRLGNQGTARDMRDLVLTVLMHGLKTNTLFENDIQKESFANNIASSYDKELIRISKILAELRINQAKQERAVGLGVGRNDYIGGSLVGNPSEFFTGVDQEQATAITVSALKNPENKRKGVEIREFVEQDAMDAIRHNLGTPNIPLSPREQNFAKSYLGVGDLLATKMYEMRNGQVFLSKGGENEVQRQTNAIVREVINDPAYLNLFTDELNLLEFDKKFLPGTFKDISSLERAMNADFLRLFREYFPSGKLSDEDILKGIGAMDTKGKPLPPGISQLFNRSATNMFQGVIKNILNAHSRQRENEARDAAIIPDAWQAFQRDTEQLLTDDRPETLAIIQIFDEDLSKTTTDEERMRVISEYAGKPWMTPVMMSNLIRKYQQTQQRLAVSQYVLNRLGQSEMAPERPVEISFMDLTRKVEIKNPSELWSNPKYFDLAKGRLTEEGAKALAIWSSPFFLGPIVTDSNRVTVRTLMDEAVNAETLAARDGNTQLQGYPLLMMAEFIAAIDSRTFPGIAESHFQSTNRIPATLKMTDADGNVTEIETYYDPNIFRRQGMFESVFGNPSNQTTNLQLHMARKIAQQIRGLPSIGRQAVLDATSGLAKNYALILSMGTRDLSNASSTKLGSGGPVGNKNGSPYFPERASNFSEQVRESIASGDHESFVNAWASLGNLFLSPTEPNLVVTKDNRHLVTKNVALSLSGFLEAQDSQLWIPAPDSFVSWYNRTAQETDRMQEGDVLPLWGGPKSIAGILRDMDEGYLEGGWFTTQFGTEEAGTQEHEMLKMIFEAGYTALDISGFGMKPQMDTLVSMLAMGKDNQMLPLGGTGLMQRLQNVYDISSLIDGHTFANGTLPTIVREYSGNQITQTKRINLPQAYHHDGSPISWGFGSPISVTNSDGEKVPMFNNKSHEVSSLFLLGKPSTSTDPVAFAEARIDYVSRNLTTPAQWDRINVTFREDIERLAFNDITNAEFFEQASTILETVLPSGTFFPPDFTGLTNNKAGLTERDFREAWSNGGYYIMEDARGTGYTTNNNGHVVIGMKGRASTRIPLDPEIMRLTNMSKLGTFLIEAGEREQQRRRELVVPYRGMGQSFKPVSFRTMLGPAPIKDYMEYTRQYEGSKKSVYKDTGGLSTIGVGHNLSAPDSKKAIQEVFKGEISHADLVSGKVSLTDAQIEALFKHDVERHLPVAHRLFGGREKFESLPDWLQVGLLDGVFQGRFKKGQKTVDAIVAGDWEGAANNINDSKAYRQALAIEERRRAEGKAPTKGGTLERYQRLEELFRRMAATQRSQA